MAKFRSIKNSFLAGQISPTAFGRTDLPQYVHACKTLRNMIPMTVGGAYCRPGTLYENKWSAVTDSAPTLIPFVASKTEGYAIGLNTVLGSGSGTVTAYRAANNMTGGSGVGVTGTHPYVMSTLANFGTIGSYDEVRDVQYAQSVDVLTLVHPNHKPRRIYRTAVDTFRITEFDQDSTGTYLTGALFRDAWPYRLQNTTAITLAINTATVGTGRTVTASAAFFNSSHVGAVFKSFDGAATYGCFKVTAFVSSTQVTVEVVVALGTTGARLTWWESAWSDYRGWPRSVAFFQQRMCYGGNASDRDSIWFSESSDFNQLSHDSITDPRSSPTGSQAFTIELSSSQLNLIQWLSAKDTLVSGTLGEEIIIDREVDTVGFGADNAMAEIKSRYGSSYTQPQRAGSELLFATGGGEEVRSFVFNDLEKAYVAEPVQLLFDEYPKAELSTGVRKFRQLGWDDSRNTLWCCDTAGNLFGMTRDRKLNVTQWHEHRMGGYNATQTGGAVSRGGSPCQDTAYSICSGSVISLAVVPNPTIGANDLWLVVKRKINGAFQYHIERMVGKFITWSTAFDFSSTATQLFLGADASVINTAGYPSVGSAVIGGLSHLEGEIPSGIAYNSKGIFKITGDAIASGNTTVQKPYPTDFLTEGVFAGMGLVFDSIVEPVRIEAGSQIGTAQGAVKRIHELTIRFYKTLSAKAGRDASNLETLIFRTGSQPLGESPDLFTGDKLIKPDSDYDRDGLIYLLRDQPLPFCVISSIAEGFTYDG